MWAVPLLDLLLNWFLAASVAAVCHVFGFLNLIRLLCCGLLKARTFEDWNHPETKSSLDLWLCCRQLNILIALKVNLSSSRFSQLLWRLLWGAPCSESTVEVWGSRRLVSFSPPLTVLLGNVTALLQWHKLLYRRERCTARLHRAAQKGFCFWLFLIKLLSFWRMSSIPPTFH